MGRQQHGLGQQNMVFFENRCNTSFAKKNACYVHITFIIGDENGCKTNSVFYFNVMVFIDPTFSKVIGPSPETNVSF